MDSMKLYARVCEKTECGHEKFICALEYAIDELCTAYGRQIVLCGMRRPIASVGQEVHVREEFILPLLDDIMYSLTGDEKYKTDFCAHAENAYRTVWRACARGRRIRGEAW